MINYWINTLKINCASWFQRFAKLILSVQVLLACLLKDCCFLSAVGLFSVDSVYNPKDCLLPVNLGFLFQDTQKSKKNC